MSKAEGLRRRLGSCVVLKNRVGGAVRMEGKYQVNVDTDALIVVHVQGDFCPGGALPVPQGDEVVPVLNRWLKIKGLLKVAARDWHPPEHCSFQRNGGPWPDHCVQNSRGAEFHPDLDLGDIAAVVSQATDPRREAYSSFDAPELLAVLKERGVRRLWIGGLATEYCVGATALDGRRHGFEVFLIEDAVRGIDVKPGDVDRALREMREAGIRIVRTEQVAGE